MSLFPRSLLLRGPEAEEEVELAHLAPLHQDLWRLPTLAPKAAALAVWAAAFAAGPKLPKRLVATPGRPAAASAARSPASRRPRPAGPAGGPPPPPPPGPPPP
eukprot:CAMPEP_0194579852 /NCGR_PEP_ID=MMETSP0292-20121207/13811_1 /TAXON_ID=39354 /ORGANISM="Heterosigma akashiwo, Strain CCMP2393" /LENGTH=102 /DNA_ID=CAMNT_0039433003 /DNA_START=457 /DNA_END=761 /DNA_ORIENTATION=+